MLKAQRLIKMAIFIVLSLSAGPVWAIQATITYQGKITSADGSPVNDTYATMVFRLWNDPVCTSEQCKIWEEEHAGVIVENSIFNVTLGETTPLPYGSDIESNDLWLEIEYKGELMTPRLAMSSVAGALYAEKAGDADTVGGKGIVELALKTELADHAGNPSAHHAKTTSFSELSDQISDAQIPSSITRDSELVAHASDSSAHHARYTDDEAVQAMGTKSDSNPLNHDRFTAQEAVQAVLANDGPASGLDADLLDGMHSNDIISAASDEVRTPISSCGTTIYTPGSYYLTQNLSCTGDGIRVTTDDVTIDLMGFTLSGDNETQQRGIYIYNSSNVEIKNGTIRLFSVGVYSPYGIVTTHSNRIIGVRAMDNNRNGIVLQSKNNTVKDCTVAENANYGIYVVREGSTFSNNTAYNNGGHGIVAGKGSTIINNTVYENGGDGIYAYYGSTLMNNTAKDNGGHGIFVEDGSTLTNNTSYNNDGDGIYAKDGSTLINNTAKNNGGDGIFAFDGSTLMNNTAKDNGGDGIHAMTGLTLTNNTVRGNQGWGIYAYYHCKITGNNICYNNQSDDSAKGGLYVHGKCFVKGNSVTLNRQNNIYVNNYSNMIEGNLVTDSANGIYFAASGNFYANNRASGNSAEDYHNGVSQTNGGGNVSF